MRIRSPFAFALGLSLIIAIAFCVLTVLALLAERERVAKLVEDDAGLVSMLDNLDDNVRASIEEHIAATRQVYEIRIRELQSQLETQRKIFESRIALLELQTGRNDQACFDRLEALGLEFRRVADFTNEQGCSMINAVHVQQFGHAKLATAVDMTCRMTEMFAIYERDVLQPLADELFRTTVEVVDHVGTYNCRTIAGSSTMSQHSYANGIDIAGFQLGDGQKFDVLRDWRTESPGAEFMRRAAYGACSIFSVALTPQFNEAHANHIHVDAGETKACH